MCFIVEHFHGGRFGAGRPLDEREQPHHCCGLALFVSAGPVATRMLTLSRHIAPFFFGGERRQRIHEGPTDAFGRGTADANPPSRNRCDRDVRVCPNDLPG
jgi:hypothetical protein